MSVVKRGRPYPAFGVLQRNLNVLFERVPHGDKRVIAAQLGVAPLTISRWLSGTQPPSPRHLASLKQVFDLPEWLPLDRVPLDAGVIARYRVSARILQLNDADLSTVQRLLDELDRRAPKTLNDRDPSISIHSLSRPTVGNS